jgi:cysteine desulfurase / selenocysteine lyase
MGAEFRGWASVQADFPLNQHLIWLNNCGTTPAGSPMRAAVEAWLRGYSERGILHGEPTYPGVKASIYGKLAGLLHAVPEEFALIHHTAEGMNFISHGLSLVPGDEILVLENEYPSNYYPWEHWKSKGVAIKAVPCVAGPGEFLAAFRAALSPKSRVAAFSAVHWCTGLPLPLEEIGRICELNGLEFVVDGAQGVGHIDIDVKACRIGYMAFSAWKWLLGPLGLGVLYVDGSKVDALTPIFKGTESVPSDESYLPYKDTWKTGADRFAYSTGSMADWVYFDAALEWLAGIGFNRARGRILELAARLGDGLRARGFQVLSDGFQGARTGIVAAGKSGLDAAAAVRDLKARGIIAAERLGRVRLSPHVYNTEEQIDRAVADLGAP